MGMLLGFILAFSRRKIKNDLIIKMLFFSVIFLIVEMIVENIVVLMLGNVVRFMTGIIFGVSVGVGIITPIKQTIGGFK
jgi:hypothetical protein